MITTGNTALVNAWWSASCTFCHSKNRKYSRISILDARPNNDAQPNKKGERHRSPDCLLFNAAC
jgi:hypothetical protein